MSNLQEIFTNREIAIGSWAILLAVILLFTKPARQFLKTSLPILFCRKFIVFYVVFLSFFGLTVYVLYWMGIWNTDLLKDTIFWVLFVELPLFVRAIEKAKDSHFFAKLIKENLTVIIIIEFILNRWTFGLITEFILVPVTVFFSLLYALSEREKKAQSTKHFFEGLIVIWGVIIIVYTIYNIFRFPEQLFSITTLKELLLPVLLLFLNLPVVYGLALYNTYEQLFIRIKGPKEEKPRMKRRIILLAGVSLSKASYIRNNMATTLVISLCEKDLNKNLEKLKEKSSMQIGDNYMKRSRFYMLWCIIGLLISMIGIILCNSEVSIKDLLTFNFILDTARLKEITTYACTTAFVLSICMLILSIGFGKKKNEEISQIKKFALGELMLLIKRQHAMIKDGVSLDNPTEFFLTYITNAYEIKKSANRVADTYENLFTRWESEMINHLALAATSLICSVGIDEEVISRYDAETFQQYYKSKKTSSPQNEKINVFIYTIQKDTEKYTEDIKLCYEEFKRYIE